MFQKKLNAIILCALLGLVWVQAIMAGTTGKISGRVVDKKTGDPFPGVNVIVEGTTLGAVSDVNGYFNILQVPPGSFKVKASSVGYAPEIASDIAVHIDQTARVDFTLQESAVQGQQVVVVAQKRIVKEDVATSVTSLTGSEVTELPMNTVSDVVGLQAGVQGGLEIRGSGSDQALFQVNGVTLRDPRNNRPISGIALSAIQEVSLERGGFNAEYGQVRSGIVNVVTKEGETNKYTGSITAKYSPFKRNYFGVSPYDPNSMWLRPYLDPEVCWDGTSVWSNYDQKQYPSFDGWNKLSERNMRDDDPTNDLTPEQMQELFKWQHRKTEKTDQPDYNIDAGFGGPVPFIGKKLGNLRFFTAFRNNREMYMVPLTRDDYKDYDWSMQLTSDINATTKLKLFGMLGKSYNVVDNGSPPTSFIRSPEDVAGVDVGAIFGNEYYSLANIDYKTISAKFTHAVSPKTFYEASIEHISRNYDTNPTSPRNPEKTHELFHGYFVDEAPFGFSQDLNPTIGDGFFMGVHTSISRDYSKISSTAFKFDLSSQVNYSNLLKTGVEFVYNKLALDYGTKDYFPEANTWVQRTDSPLRASLYAQDKFEIKGLIVNAGLRLDYNNSNTDWIHLNAFDPFFSGNYDKTKTYATQKTKGDVSLSPRLGISHPITVNSKLFFNYGHFKQLPTYEDMFVLTRGGGNKQVQRFGNPNLALAKTISYELGYDHALFDNYLVQLAAFYHDITDQQGTVQYFSSNGSIKYDAVTSNNYADVRGFEVTLRKPSGRWWAGFMNYTYQVTTSGFFGYLQNWDDPAEQKRYLRTTTDFYQDKPTPQPYARANLSFFTPSTFGPKFAGLNPLGDWRANVIGEWNSGYWGTWNPNQVRGISANVHYKDYYNVALRLNKTIPLKWMDVTLFMEISNLLNSKFLNLNNAFSDNFDEQDYFKSLHLPENHAYDNIVGTDRPGDVRPDGVAFQPLVWVQNRWDPWPYDSKVIYYENETKTYVKYVDDLGDFVDMEQATIDKIKKDKAYIDMPNRTSFNYLNPRRFFWGVRISFNLN